VFIGAIITATFIVAIANQVNLSTNTFSRLNATAIAPAVNTTLDITGRELVGTGFVINTSNRTDTANGVILQTGIGSDGLLHVQLRVNDTGSRFSGQSVNVSYTFNPDGYVSEQGGRTITTLILLFSALAIVVFVIIMFIKHASLGDLMRRN
jgi:hypothetical protein